MGFVNSILPQISEELFYFIKEKIRCKSKDLSIW